MEMSKFNDDDTCAWNVNSRVQEHPLFDNVRSFVKETMGFSSAVLV
jgi:hypothetical protein